MKMIIVTQCCCGCSVRTGSLIIGIVFGILSVLDLIIEVILATKPTDEEEKGNEYMTKGEAITSAIFSLLVLAACVLLIFGTLKERLKCIVVWLVVYCAYSAFLPLYMLQICITVMIYTDQVQLLWEIPPILFVLAMSLYSLVVVYSHYRNLKDQVTLPPRTPVVMTV